MKITIADLWSWNAKEDIILFSVVKINLKYISTMADFSDAFD